MFDFGVSIAAPPWCAHRTVRLSWKKCMTWVRAAPPLFSTSSTLQHEGQRQYAVPITTGGSLGNQREDTIAWSLVVIANVMKLLHNVIVIIRRCLHGRWFLYLATERNWEPLAKLRTPNHCTLRRLFILTGCEFANLQSNSRPLARRLRL